ncbi:MAG: LemA family protein [Abditibacteriota bacterium]|nr:LemA family protein [Abditibacteriota bacterium]
MLLIVLLCLGALLIAAVAIVLWGIGTYNRLVQMRNKIDYTWAQVDVVLKKRFDLVPGLVETVRGYAKHESETLEKVIQARSMLSRAGTVAEQAEANNFLTGALKSIFALAEAYPELKANEGFLRLQEELTNIENKLVYQRQFYNDTVYAFNTVIMQFPTNVIAGMFKFAPRDLFKTEQEEEREPVRFSF